MTIEKLKGLGPKSQSMLEAIGIVTDEDFLRADPFDLYQRLKAQGASVSLNLLYAMIGAQEDRHWQDVKRESKLEILLRLDDMGLAPKK